MSCFENPHHMGHLTHMKATHMKHLTHMKATHMNYLTRMKATHRMCTHVMS